MSKPKVTKLKEELSIRQKLFKDPKVEEAIAGIAPIHHGSATIIGDTISAVGRNKGGARMVNPGNKSSPRGGRAYPPNPRVHEDTTNAEPPEDEDNTAEDTILEEMVGVVEGDEGGEG